MYRCISEDPRIDLLVIFAEAGAVPRFDSGFGRVIKWQDDLLEGFPSILIGAQESERSRAVLRELAKFGPSAIYVHGYAVNYLRDTIHWARRSGVPVLITTDSELRHPRPWYIRIVKRFLLPRVFRKVDVFLTVGDENERYFRYYGVPEERFHRVPFSIDSAFYDKVLANQADVRQKLRQQLGIPPETVVILTVGKLIPRKEHASLIRAFAAAVRSADHSAVLLIAGDGPLRPELEELAKPLGSAVRLLGFIRVQQLPEYYSGADIYVHPSSHDPHPLAISEALYCGLPVVVSDRTGSAGPTDDVQVGFNGWVYSNGDDVALAKILAHLIDNPEVRASLGAHSRELGLLHSSSRCATRFVEGALRAIQTRQTKQG
jgi:glycosyltransferase involved in cell wall biosynthesis